MASPRLIIVSTLATQANWTSRLTTIADRDPEEAIEMVRQRPSTGGRPWAKPACKLAAPARVSAARAGATVGDPVALFRVRGPFGPEPRETLASLMRRAAERMGTNWREAGERETPQPGQWQHRLDHRGDVSGRIAVHLPDADSVQQTVEALNDAVVNFTGTPSLLSVEAVGITAGHGHPVRG